MDNGVKTLRDSFEKIPIDDSFKLIAGPGAGKTTFLVNHISHVIKNSDKLKNGCKILCITYTNVAVDAIKKKLEDNVNEVEICTIHHFLFEHIMKPYLWVIKDKINPNLLDLSIIKDSYPSFSLLPHCKEKFVKLNMHHEKVYSQLKNIYWGFDNDDNLIPICKGKINFSNQFLKDYKKLQWDKSRITPDDILKFSYDILNEEPCVADIIRIKFPYIFIDEFQDTCTLQRIIIEKICDEKIVMGIIGDPAQSIYSFRGANYGNLNEIKLNLINYEINMNHRSTDKILNVLNNLRGDGFVQIAGRIGEYNNPTILVGDEISAYNYVTEFISSENLNILAYKHGYLNEIQFQINYEGYEDNSLCVKKFWQENDYPRDRIIEYTVRAIESFREKDVKNALKYIKFAFHNFDFDEDYLIKKLFNLSFNYSAYVNETLKGFYNKYIYLEEIDDLKYITRGKINDIYESILYIDLVKDIKHNSNSLFRTIHSCKGDEFDNVLIFTEDASSNFLLNFDIDTNLHRVFYVAMSRARENLFISMPQLDESKHVQLKNIGFTVINFDK